jgi:D-xylose 1-dehydrogenase (NADP+, D-xylono-1,5-lactone-forming)
VGKGGRVGWGILGAAHIARKAVLPAIAASSNGRVVAVASRSAERAREVLAPYPGARVVDSYEELVADPEVDAVYNPLPNSLHREWSILALNAGKHVLCEKPIALNASEAEEMAAAANAAGRHLMEAFMYRFHPAMLELVERARNAIHVAAEFGFQVRSREDIRLRADTGGGALLDVGCYTVSVARWILGEPEHISAQARFRDGVDLATSALLRFPGGGTASAWSSLESAEVQDLTVITRDAVFRRSPAFNARDDHDPYRLMIESFDDSVIRDRPVAIPMAESIRNMRVLDAIRDASTS